jgi:hypothetical protein
MFLKIILQIATKLKSNAEALAEHKPQPLRELVQPKITSCVNRGGGRFPKECVNAVNP